MPYTQTDPQLPFNGEPDSLPRACSRAGAAVALPRAGSQAGRLLALYQVSGPKTDHEVAARLGLPLSTVNARRNALMARGLVVVKGTALGPFGAPNTLYGVA